MASCDESALVSTVVFDCVHHTYMYLFVSYGYGSTFAYILKGIIIVQLGEFKALGICPFGVAMTGVWLD